MGKGEMPSPLPCPSMPVTVGRADPEITRVGEVVLHPTYSSPWQSRPCTKTIGTLLKSTIELTLGEVSGQGDMRTKGVIPISHLPYGGMGEEKKMPSLSSPLVTYSSCENWPRDQKNGKAGLAPH